MTTDELTARGVRVKPLEWTADEYGNYRADGATGLEGIDLLLTTEGDFFAYDVWGVSGDFPTLEAAKAAAQADYEARILSALEMV